jgi:hypothetical protein
MRGGIIVALLLLSGPVPAQDTDKKAEAAKPAAEEKKKPEAPPVIQIEKSNKPDPCIIRPVMTDKDLRDCGAQVGDRKATSQR